MFEREITQQRLLERLGLLGERLDRCRGAADERTDHVGVSAELSNRRLDGRGAIATVAGVLRQLPLDGFGPGLRNACLGDLDLGVGQIQNCAQLR